MADVQHSELLQLTGIPIQQDACLVLIKTAWNAAIVDELERGCRSKLAELGISEWMIRTITVPGAVEIPFAIHRYWKKTPKKQRPDALVALGCVVRGDTPHFDYVCRAVTDGVLFLNLELPVPVVFGILTVDNEEQAMERIGGKHGHKGEEAAMTAIKMIRFNQSL